MSTAQAPKSATDFRVMRVEMEIAIRASPPRVWDALVHETTHWWRKDFLTRASKGFHIEPRVGGRAFEDRGDGNGSLWFIVTSIDPPESINLIGHLTPQYGGPAQSMLELKVEPRDDGRASVLRVSDTLWGNLSDSTGKSINEGWRLLFEDALKKYVEQKRA